MTTTPLQPKKENPTAKRNNVFWLSGVFLTVLVLAVASLSAWFYFGQLEESITATGQMVPEGKLRRIMSPVSGIVANLNVAENERVEAGDVLLELNTQTADIQADTLGRQLDQMLSEATVLNVASGGGNLPLPRTLSQNSGAPQVNQVHQDWLVATEKRYQQELTSANKRTERLEHEVQEALANKSRIEKLLLNSTELLKEYQTLYDEGGLSRNELRNFEQNVIHQEGELAAAKENVAARQLALEESQGSPTLIKANYDQMHLDKLTTVNQQISVIEGDIKTSDLTQSRHQIKAPVGGVVHKMEVRGTDEVIGAGEELISIVPDDAKLVAEVQVPNTDLSFIHIGQKAALRVDAFPYAVYGRMDAEVVAISPSTVKDNYGNPYYVVRIKPVSNSFTYQGEEHLMRSGMTISTDLITRNKSILSFFTEPLGHQMKTAFKDPSNR